jgi:protein TonB
MFDDFYGKNRSVETHKRFGGSMLVASILYGAMSVSIIAATANVHDGVPAELTQVEFAPARPDPVPETKKAEPAPAPKTVAKRKKINAPPKELSKSKLAESDAPLGAADSVGPIDGLLEEAKPPPPPPPPPKPEAPPPRPKPIAKVMPPVALTSNKAPKYNSRAIRAQVEGTVVVTFTVEKDGTVSNVLIVSGPAELGEIVAKTVAQWRFQPATQGGVPVAFKKTMNIKFRLENA